VSVVCCTDRGLCDDLITCPGEFYGLRCVWVWSLNLDNEAH